LPVIGRLVAQRVKVHSFFQCKFNSTIYALSSGHGKCGVAVIRVTGPTAASALTELTSTGTLPPPRLASLRTLRHPQTRRPLDSALTLWFPEPNSFTGEDSVELQVHGGVAVVNAVMAALGSLKDLRPAEPGEFTRRAFHAGKLDLSQVEGLGDLIHAETEHQRRQAIGQMTGTAFRDFSRRLLKEVANVEAYIDFAESEEIEDGLPKEVERAVRALAGEFVRHLADARAGERLRSGVRVAIVGEPNVGKSTLLNLIAQRPVAIVSPIAGTTRDALETCLDVGGFPVVVVDTAGLREETADPIEREGIRRALDNAKSADLIIMVVDASVLETTETESLMESAREILDKFKIERGTKTIVIANKCDLVKYKRENSAEVKFVSCKTDAGVGAALADLTGILRELCATSLGENPLLTRQRHRLHLEKALGHLEDYLEDAEDGILDYAVSGQHLRLALRELGQISGKVSSEQILDVIFADFCIGK